MKSLLSTACAVFALATAAVGAPQVGSPAPDFKSLETAEGKKVSLSDFKQDVLVFAVTCNHCPVAIANEDRLIEFAKNHCGPDGKVALLAVNVSTSEEDALPAMKVRAKEKGFNFPYIYDPSQKLGKDLGAKKTPEFFVFDKSRKLVYTGKFDDSVLDPSKVNNKFVEDVVEAVLNGKEPPKSNKAEGCGIRYES